MKYNYGHWVFVMFQDTVVVQFNSGSKTAIATATDHQRNKAERQRWHHLAG